MTYNEWRDELKSNLLSVSENERRRVLDYYAEAYADRRDAGYTEREIIEDFGAPYDAAMRILDENKDYSDEFIRPDEKGKKRADEPSRQQPQYNQQQYSQPQYTQPQPQYAQQPPVKKKQDYTWVFVLLCIIFAIPLFGLIMAMVGITIGFTVAPFGLLIWGVCTAGGGVGVMVGGNVAAGACQLGLGLIIFGVSIVLLPLFIKLVKLMWAAFKSLFGFIKRQFSGKEAN